MHTLYAIAGVWQIASPELQLCSYISMATTDCVYVCTHSYAYMLTYTYIICYCRHVANSFSRTTVMFVYLDGYDELFTKVQPLSVCMYVCMCVSVERRDRERERE